MPVQQKQTITGCTVEGTVTASNRAAGIVSQNNGTIRNCSSAVSVTGSYDGGIAVSNYGTIEYCRNAGVIQASRYAGGIVASTGGEDAKILDCYNRGTVICTETETNCYAGGIAGNTSGSSSNTPLVQNCYNVGQVSAKTSGGILGYANYVELSGCYYLNTIGKGIGYNVAALDTTVSCSEALMKKQRTFVSYDFESVWTRVTGEYEYPILAWEYQPSMELAEPDGPNYLPDGSIIVADAIDLYYIRNDMTANYILTADIDLTEALAEGGDLYNETYGWIPLGYNPKVSSTSVEFTGTLDGNGHKITGLLSKNNNSEGVAGFIYKNSGTIQNLSVEGIANNSRTYDSSVGFLRYAAGIVCQNNNNGTIRNCSSAVSVTCSGAGSYGGGIAASNYGTIEYCSNAGVIQASSRAGGIVASTNDKDAKILDCYNRGTVICTETDCYAGGIVGYSYSYFSYKSLVQNCYNVGQVSGGTSGGILGYANNVELSGCYYLNTIDKGIGLIKDGGSITDTTVSCPEALMKKQRTFVEYDFDTVWVMGTGDYLFPILQWEIPATGLVNPFVDVSAGQFFYEPVLWAVNCAPQITKGTDATHFSPGVNCKRRDIVTFLWRANHCPEPSSTECPFTDVPANAYYTKAVLWAVESGITSGTSATTFSPAATCKRRDVVTFLWRAAGSPEPSSTENPFHDVPNGAYYTKAVLWAVEKGITNGLNATTFGPTRICTRGQIVTFLYRAYSN